MARCFSSALWSPFSSSLSGTTLWFFVSLVLTCQVAHSWHRKSVQSRHLARAFLLLPGSQVSQCMDVVTSSLRISFTVLSMSAMEDMKKLSFKPCTRSLVSGCTHLVCIEGFFYELFLKVFVNRERAFGVFKSLVYSVFFKKIKKNWKSKNKELQ